MKLRYGSKVFAADREQLGVIKELVVEPLLRTITHMVIQKGLFFGQDRVIPVDLVAASDAEQVVLRVNAQELADLQHGFEFREDEFIPLADEQAEDLYGGGTSVWVRPPYMGLAEMPLPSIIPPGFAALPTEIEPSIPLEDVSLEKGSVVLDADGKRVGKVDELFTDNEENITHLILREGIIFSVAKMVPIDFVAAIRTNEVRLAVNAELIEQLPEPPPQE